MIETSLLNYGVLGLWVLVLLAKEINFNKQVSKVIENNTKALERNCIYFEQITKRKGGNIWE